ncbi:MAG TPA: phage tail sheath subtilisin-like domain-containing protein [Gaiellaceae bacterium]|nr:phage tail sheath subtilisin-like domain-containing protein [Gaiellaceae bacterium]
MAPQIDLPPEISRSDKTPRTAVAFDRTSGVKQTSDLQKFVLLVGQKLAAGSIASGVPVDLFRETDSENFFGPGSVLDAMAKAAFKAYPLVRMRAVAVDDPVGAKATNTVTFVGTATGADGAELFVAGRRVAAQVSTGDTATVIAAALRDAVNAIVDLPVVATAAAGVVTLTAQNKGVAPNDISVRADMLLGTSGVTVAVGTAKMTGGAGAIDVTAALAAVAAVRHHDIALGVNDGTNAGVLSGFLDLQGDAEHSHGQVGIIAVATPASLASTTTLATTLDGVRMLVYWLEGSESWFPTVAAAAAAVMSSEEDPAKPYNTLPLPGILPPPIASRPIRGEITSALANGVSPLVVVPGDQVAILRAVSTHTLDGGGHPDYSVFDIMTIQSFDYMRDNIEQMFSERYARSKWADDDPDGLLPPDVATPAKVKDDIIDVCRTLERLGILQQVEELKDEIVVNKVGTNCQFSIPADFVQSLQEALGKIVLIQAPFAA